MWVMKFVVSYEVPGKDWTGKTVSKFRVVITIKKYNGGGSWEDEESCLEQVSTDLRSKGISAAADGTWWLTFGEWEGVLTGISDYEKKLNTDRPRVRADYDFQEAF